MSSVPIRNVVLTAAGASLEEIMTAVWTDIGASSTWTQVTQTSTTSPAVAATGTLGVITPTNPSPGATIVVNGATLTPAGGPRGVGTSAHNYNDQLGTAAAISADIVAAWSDPSNFFFGVISDCTASDLTGSVLFTANTLGTGGNGYVFTSTDGTNYPVTGSGFLTGGLDVVPGPPGARSFAIRSPDTTMELNMIWSSTTQAVLGINADTSGGVIGNSAAPWTTANFSNDQAPGGLPVDIATPANAEFILLEWPDAIMIITKDAGRTSSLGAFHWGKIWHQPLTGLESADAGIRLDGNAVVPGRCRRGSSGFQTEWISTSTDYPTICVRRFGTGNTEHNNPNINPSFAWQNGEFSANQNVVADASYTYSGDRIAGPLVYSMDTIYQSDNWIWKYVRRVGQLKAPFLLYTVGVVDTYMTLNYVLTSNCDLVVLIRDNFIPNP